MPRPPSEFHGFVGQGRVVARLRKQLAGATAHGEPCPSILLIGPSGVGKTMLARSIGLELGTAVLVAHGQDAAPDVAAKLLRCRRGDVFFVDEAHNAPARVQEMLYQVIDESRVPASARPAAAAVAGATPGAGPGGEDGGDDSLVEIPRVTVVLATDQPGRLLDALYKRMELVESLEPYPGREMGAIVEALATGARLRLSGQARRLIAGVSAGLPRLARHLLRNLRRHFPGADDRTIGAPAVRQFLRASGVDAQGLRREHRALLRHLGTVGKASVESLARRLGADADHVRRQVEPRLLQLDLIRITPGGRALTDGGSAWLAARAVRRGRQGRARPPGGRDRDAGGGPASRVARPTGGDA